MDETKPALSAREFEAFQSFVLSTKLYWTSEMFVALKRTYEAKRASGAGDDMPPGPARVEALLKDEPLDRYHRWFERHLQRMKYSGRLGLVPFHQSRRAALLDALEADVEAPLASGALELDPALRLPAYYREVDVHQHPGGVWSDALGGLVYEAGARSTTPLLTRDRDLHERFADLVKTMQPAPATILDMGCGFGKTTQPLAEVFPGARVTGIDLSAPCLKVAARNAVRAQARNLAYVQKDAAGTGLVGDSFDAVTSTMLLHEMPAETVTQVIRESARLLRPGGTMAHLDFLPPDDEFLAYLHVGHSYRNNEPWMRSLMALDLPAVMRDAGLEEIRIEPFEEAEGALAQSSEKWRFPWTLIAGRKPATGAGRSSM